ncbi:LysE/ArgO family amino acid transporter [Parageobacillus toebii]|uniref:LysE/ArgO family amino acid transporter n=1 Tax=Parageobacillus toebii TaxID=153151 RepID=UPI002E1FF5FE|nr:LysE/ArgO family amino acid transporter [Parageobacillus toebii]
MLTAFIHGFILALGLILPLGAQNVFVLQQGAMQPRFLRALPAVLTAALCDTALILLAVLGVSVVVFTMPWLQTILFAVGFFFLLYMGWTVWKSQPSSANDQGSMPPKKQILFALSVSLLNPHAILDTIGMIGTNSLNYDGAEKVTFTGACISVSWLWFFFLAIAGKTIGQIDQKGTLMKRINQLSALIIWAVAVYLAVELLNNAIHKRFTLKNVIL